MKVQESNSEYIFFSDSCSGEKCKVENTQELAVLKRQYHNEHDSKHEEKREFKTKKIKKMTKLTMKCHNSFLRNYVLIQKQLIKRYRVKFDPKFQEKQFEDFSLQVYLQKLIQQSKICLANVQAKTSQIQKTYQQNVYQCKFCSQKFSKACALGGHIASLHSQKRRSLKIRTQKQEKNKDDQDQFYSPKIKQQIFESSQENQKKFAVKYEYRTPEKRQKNIKRQQNITMHSLKNSNVNPPYTPPMKRAYKKRNFIGTN